MNNGELKGGRLQTTKKFTFAAVAQKASLLKSRKFIRIGSLLIVLGLLTSQVGLNFFHSHRSSAPETPHVAIQIGDTAAPCSVCALGVMPNLCVEFSSITSVLTFSPDFIIPAATDVLVNASSAVLGRAPPVR